MKKWKLAIIAAAAMALVTACGDQGDSSAKVDTDALMNSLVSDITYTEELKKLDADDISNYISVPEGVEAVMYMSSGSTAEEAAVFTAPDADTAKTVKENVEFFLDDQKASFKDYIPEEAQRIKDAVLVCEGNYVVLCVSDNSEQAKQIIEKAVGAK